MLKITDLTAGYGPVVVLHSISLEVPKGNVVAVLGANGAGKSTMARTISGLTDIFSGTVELQGKNIAGIAPYKVAGLGIAHVPERRELFSELTVAENLRAGSYNLKNKKTFKAVQTRVLGYFPVLTERLRSVAGSLSGGEQQMLSIARGLMATPMLLVLDEPSLGLAPLIIQQIFKTIEQLNRQESMTTLLVEQNVRLALSICQKGYVMETGHIVLSGTSAELAKDEMVIRSYLGD